MYFTLCLFAWKIFINVTYAAADQNRHKLLPEGALVLTEG